MSSVAVAKVKYKIRLHQRDSSPLRCRVILKITPGSLIKHYTKEAIKLGWKKKQLHSVRKKTNTTALFRTETLVMVQGTKKEGKIILRICLISLTSCKWKPSWRGQEKTCKCGQKEDHNLINMYSSIYTFMNMILSEVLDG